MSISATIRELKANDEDLEWYPSTDEIIRKVAHDIKETRYDGYHDKIDSLLDIGAGDGRVLKAVQKILKEISEHIDLYAIEKAIYHLSNMPKDITVIGTDFEQQSLSDKPMGAIFCNPPYSEFEAWTLKIVKEASAKYVYLVIPRRWRDSAEIKRALENRSADVDSLGEFDFESADRKARARVEIVKISFNYENRDAFDSVVEEMLPELDIFEVELKPEVVNFHDGMISGGRNLVDVLVDAYDAELVEMIENYRAALRIDSEVLREIGVTKSSVLGGIGLKIKGLKHKYWKVLFDEMDTITQRLASKQRAGFLESLKNKKAIDFTANNVYAILIWVSKWSNDYFDEQLIELFRSLSTDSNVVRYKSNQRVWLKKGWRYLHGEEGEPTHYKLEYRIILSHGGICTSEWGFRRDENNGLAASAWNLLKDICTVANNLGFPCKDSPKNFQWESNKQHVLRTTDGEPLVAVRAFKNGNMHLHFNPKFMLALNVEAGRLLKWIRNPAEAVVELGAHGAEAKQVEDMFGSSFRISPESGFLKLTSG